MDGWMDGQIDSVCIYRISIDRVACVAGHIMHIK